MGVSSSESHDLTAFYEMLSASFGVLSQNTGFYPSLDRIIETMLGPLNLGPGGGSYNEPISRLQRASIWTHHHQPTTRQPPGHPSGIHSIGPQGCYVHRWNGHAGLCHPAPRLHATHLQMRLLGQFLH